MSLFTDAFAGTGQAGPTDNGISMMLMMAGFGLIFYFLVWRPQSQRAKEQQEMLKGLKKGDEVMTTGGIMGLIAELSDHYVTVTIADGINIKLQRSAITASLPKGTLKSI